ncbi:hypothetical protein [Streptomyces sp. PTD5-9]|uniref:hypothetical protein n=1 Tax=Streptomyces sp. PTD5-9 TaxID=3120150 RepID=UPI00300B7168
MNTYARGFRLHLRHGLVLEGAEFPGGRAIVMDDPEWGLCSAARTIEVLQAGYPDSRIERPAARRTLTEAEHHRAWHAIEGAAGEPGADPGTILAAVLAALDITAPDAPTAVPDHPTGQKYPCGLGVVCDTCGTGFRGDFIVTDTMTQAERQAAQLDAAHDAIREAEQDAETADTVTAETKRLLARRTTTMRHRAEQAEAVRDRLARDVQAMHDGINQAVREAFAQRRAHREELRAAEHHANRYRLAWLAARRDRKADRAAMAAELPAVQAGRILATALPSSADFAEHLRRVAGAGISVAQLAEQAEGWRDRAERDGNRVLELEARTRWDAALHDRATAAERRAEQAEAAIARMRQMHRDAYAGTTEAGASCTAGCGAWPCPTLTALDEPPTTPLEPQS